MTDNASGLRVLQLLPALVREEPVQAALGLVRPLAASGGLVVVASPGGRLEPQLERTGGRLFRLQPPRALSFGADPNLKALAGCCADDRLHLIHAHGLAQVSLAIAAAEATGLPLVVSCYEVPESGSFTTRLRLRALAKAQQVVAASDYLADHLAKRVPKLASRIVTIPHGINVTAFDEAAVTTARTISLAEVWGVIEDPRPIILVPSRHEDRTWPDTLCKVVSQCVKQRGGHLDAQFVLIGEDQRAGRSARLENKIIAAGLAPLVRLVGHCADPEAALKLASVVLAFSAMPRGVCYMALQAQAMGRPVVIGNTGAAPEAVQDGITGWLVSPDRPGLAAEKILAALALDESARAHLALAARARIVTQNSSEVMNRSLLALYEALVVDREPARGPQAATQQH